jgi:uncharacterized protein (DUF2062 family)
VRYRRQFKYYLLKFLRLRGTPHTISLSFALGSIINFVPTFGFAIPIAGFGAAFLRGNIVAAVIGDIIFKPLFPIFFYLDVRVGHLLLGKTTHHIGKELKAFIHMTDIVALKTLGASFFLGMFSCMVIAFFIIYMFTHTILKYYRLAFLRFIRNLQILDGKGHK